MASDAMTMPWEGHEEHEWREVPPCVYCVLCDVRLYQGSLPEWKDPELAARRAACEHREHEMANHGDDDEPNWQEMGLGFYWVCADCGFKGWYD